MNEKAKVFLPFEEPEFAELCRRLDISYIGLFGSTARGEQRRDSDVDLLVRFSVPKSLLDVIQAEYELEDFLGYEVDLVTEGNIKPRIKERIMQDLRDVYGTR